MVGTAEERQVFIAYRQHNNSARDVMDRYLRSLQIMPSYIHDISIDKKQDTIERRLKKAFEEAQAFMILLTADDESTLLPIWNHDDLTASNFQPRQNVVLEAGMAMGLMMRENSEYKVILVQMVKPRIPFNGPTDWTGQNYFELNMFETNMEVLPRLVKRLEDAGCAPLKGPHELENREHFAADFEDAILRPRKWFPKSDRGETRLLPVLEGKKSLKSLDMRITCGNPRWRAGVLIGSEATVNTRIPKGSLLYHAGAMDDEQGLSWYTDFTTKNGAVDEGIGRGVTIQVKSKGKGRGIYILVNGQRDDFDDIRFDDLKHVKLGAWNDGVPYDDISIWFDYETY